MSAQQLYLLQKVDTQIMQLHDESKRIHTDLSISSGLEKATAKVNAASKVYHDLLNDQDRVQAKSTTLTSKISENEKLLYSGQVSNPKELSGISTDLVQLRKRLDSSDDTLLELMDKVEKMQTRLNQAEAGVKEQAELTKQATSEKQFRLDKIETELTRLTLQRDETLERVNPDELEIYKQLMSTKGHIAVSEIHVGRCSGCKITVSSSNSQRAHAAKELVHCSSCGRILLN
jgi:hypothetical protein